MAILCNCPVHWCLDPLPAQATLQRSAKSSRSLRDSVPAVHRATILKGSTSVGNSTARLPASWEQADRSSQIPDSHSPETWWRRGMDGIYSTTRVNGIDIVLCTGSTGWHLKQQMRWLKILSQYGTGLAIGTALAPRFYRGRHLCAVLSCSHASYCIAIAVRMSRCCHRWRLLFNPKDANDQYSCSLELMDRR